MNCERQGSAGHLDRDVTPHGFCESFCERIVMSVDCKDAASDSNAATTAAKFKSRDD
jgi:hypothetical protein